MKQVHYASLFQRACSPSSCDADTCGGFICSEFSPMSKTLSVEARLVSRTVSKQTYIHAVHLQLLLTSAGTLYICELVQKLDICS